MRHRVIMKASRQLIADKQTLDGIALANCGLEPIQTTSVIKHVGSAVRAGTPLNVILNSLIFAAEIHKCAHAVVAVFGATTFKPGVAERGIELVLQPTAGSNPSARAFRQPACHPGGIVFPGAVSWDLLVEHIQRGPLFVGFDLRQPHAMSTTELLGRVVTHASR